MTQKDFIELAKQLAIAKPVYTGDMEHMDYAYHCEADQTWRNCVYAVVLACQATSANFDRGKFLTACGIPNIGIK